jgi:hypothetical protein
VAFVFARHSGTPYRSNGIDVNIDTKCPHCGLPLTIVRDFSGPVQLRYDPDDWRRRCKRPELGGPAMCFAEEAPNVQQSKAVASGVGGGTWRQD